MKILDKIKLDLNNPIKIINRLILNLPCPLKLQIAFRNYYRKRIYKKLIPYFIKAYKYIKHNNIKLYRKSINSGIIWIFWWQGKYCMPLIVKRCIQSVIKHSNGHKVILITKYNIRKYTNISNNIYKKLYNNNMTLTHFSDILRFNLLANHGGLWIDSTVFCSSDLTSKYFNNIYTSGGYDYKQSLKLYFSKWTEFLIGGKSHSSIFEFMNNFFKIYWEDNNSLLDYFLVDYGLMYVYKHNMSDFNIYVNNIANKNNPHLYDLMDCLNDSFNLELYKYITANTSLFKLTYKKQFRNTNDTFYHRLLNGTL